MTRTHYDVLGVRPDASTAEIKAAHRAAARRLHPDLAGGGSAAVGASSSASRVTMAEVNAAWAVLGDPRRRAEYDVVRGMVGTDSASGRPGSGRPAVDSPPTVVAAKVPWRFALAMVGTLIVVGMVGWATADDSEPRPVIDNLLEVGECVDLRDNGVAEEVACSFPHDAVVEVFVPAGLSTPPACPEGTTATPDRQGLGTACVRAVVGG